jgi:hypothetical protein
MFSGSTFAFGHIEYTFLSMSSADALLIYANRLQANRFRLCVDYI